MLFTSPSRLHIAKCNKLPKRMNKIVWYELNGENNTKHSHIEHCAVAAAVDGTGVEMMKLEYRIISRKCN